MKLPMQIAFRNVPRTDAVETILRKKAQALEKFSGHIMACRVAVDTVQKHKHRGRLFSVRVDLTVPRTEIVVNRDQAEDIRVAIRNAFDAARRQLDGYARRIRGDVKSHGKSARRVMDAAIS